MTIKELEEQLLTLDLHTLSEDELINLLNLLNITSSEITRIINYRRKRKTPLPPNENN